MSPRPDGWIDAGDGTVLGPHELYARPILAIAGTHYAGLRRHSASAALVQSTDCSLGLPRIAAGVAVVYGAHVLLLTHNIATSGLLSLRRLAQRQLSWAVHRQVCGIPRLAFLVSLSAGRNVNAPLAPRSPVDVGSR